MNTTRSVGRTIGALIIAQIAGAALVNLVLVGPAITAAPGFLENAAARSLEVGLGVLIGFVTGAISTAIAILALPVFRRYSYVLAFSLLALGIVAFALTVVENSAVMSMLSFSKAYTNASPGDAMLFQALRVVAASARNWAHYSHALIGGATYLVFYIVLYRFALIPRALAALGAAAVALQMIAVSLPFLGYRVVMLMIAPMGLVHLSLGVWLAVKGFEPAPVPLQQADTDEGSGLAQLQQ